MTIDRKLFDEKFAQLRRGFSTRLEEYAEQLDQLLCDADSPVEADTAVTAAIADLLHRISGTAGSFGFGQVSSHAGRIDAAFATGEDASGHRDALRALVVLLRTEAATAAASSRH